MTTRKLHSSFRMTTKTLRHGPCFALTVSVPCCVWKHSKSCAALRRAAPYWTLLCVTTFHTQTKFALTAWKDYMLRRISLHNRTIQTCTLPYIQNVSPPSRTLHPSVLFQRVVPSRLWCLLSWCTSLLHKHAEIKSSQHHYFTLQTI